MVVKVGRRSVLAGAVTALAGTKARAQATGVIRVGALTDLGGPYRDIEGPTGTECARQAIAEFTAANPDIKVELFQADHHNKPDVASTIVRQWFDRDGRCCMDPRVALQVGLT